MECGVRRKVNCGGRQRHRHPEEGDKKRIKCDVGEIWEWASWGAVREKDRERRRGGKGRGRGGMRDKAAHENQKPELG